MSPTLYWFRNDLRLSDNPAWRKACADASALVPAACAPDASPTRWGFARVGPQRLAFWAQAAAGLDVALRARGSALWRLDGPGDPASRLVALARQIGARQVVCEAIAAPEEQAEVAALRAAGLTVDEVWQSSLVAPEDLPFKPEAVPDVFTDFRRRLESAGLSPREPVPEPARTLAWPEGLDRPEPWPVPQPAADTRSSFPFHEPAWSGSEASAQAHVRRYFASDAPVHYKATRNGLTGTGYSTKFSPWLAVGALSAPQIHAELARHEAVRGRSDGSGWIVFELLWRDHFRWLHRKHGAALYRARGLRSSAPAARHDAQAFAHWSQGRTGQPLVDAAMRELRTTGYLSNRLRQLVASFWVHDLRGDWRAGAAWFESQLVDYDVYSNQGNWLYLAGRGTDPRGGRRFNPEKQAREHDPDGVYQALWARD